MCNSNDTPKTFHDSTTFEKDIERILKKIIEEKLPAFLEYCIQTHNAEPIMQVIYTLSTNKF